MVSLNGVPYENHPAAFQYRAKYDKSCTCGSNRPSLFSVAGNLRLSEADGRLSLRKPQLPGGARSVALPRARPGLGEDPETVINRAGDFRIDAITRLAGARRATGRDGRPVRIVGPAYWGDQSREEVVLTPVPN